MSYEVPIYIDIVLVHTAQVAESIRVQRMDEHKPNV